MDHSFNPDPSGQAGVCAVLRLVPKTVLRVDAEALARLHIALGPSLAGATLMRAHDDLAHQIETVTVAHADCAFDQMAVAVRRIRRLSVDMGLPEMRRVADHVLDCLSSTEATALAATVARLIRIGQAALAQSRGLQRPGG